MKVTITTTPTNLSITDKRTNLVIAGPAERTVVTVKTPGPMGPPGPAFDTATDYTLYYDLAKG